jgi:hypothetical protein
VSIVLISRTLSSLDTFRLSLAVTVGVSVAFHCLTAAAQARVPSIDIKQTCRATTAAMISLERNDYDHCVESEQMAYQKLLHEWNKFATRDRTDCVQPAAYLPSYIEWLTCFEMIQAAREGRKARGEDVDNPNAPVVLPRIRPTRNY